MRHTGFTLLSKINSIDTNVNKTRTKVKTMVETLRVSEKGAFLQ